MSSLKYGALVPLLALACGDSVYPGWAGINYYPLGCLGVWEDLTGDELEALAGQYGPFERSYSVGLESFAEEEWRWILEEEGPWMVSNFSVSIRPTFEYGRRFIPYTPEQFSLYDETVKCGELTATKLQVETHSDIYTDGMCMGEMTHTVVDGKHDQTDWVVSRCPYAFLTYEETAEFAEREGVSLFTDWPRHVKRRSPSVSILDQKNNAIPLEAARPPFYGLGMSYLRKVETREYTVSKTIERGPITRVSE